MPYCEILTSCKVSAQTQRLLDKEFGRIIELIPGKSERWVMTHTEDEAKMCFAGDSEAPCAMITVKTFGALTELQYDMLTKEFCSGVSKLLGVPADRIYVVYQPIENWGWHGANF